MIILIFTVVVLAILVYVLIRPWLKKQTWAQSFFAWIEPIELALFQKSETLLWARLKIFTGLLLTALTQTQTLDITPLMPFVKAEYQDLVRFAWNCIPLALTVIGWIDERLRKDTGKPTALVAVPDDAPPAVKNAIAAADAAKEQAVLAVQQAKADGSM